MGSFEAMHRECEGPWLQSFEVGRWVLRGLIMWRIAQFREGSAPGGGRGNGLYMDMIRSQADLKDQLGTNLSDDTCPVQPRPGLPVIRADAAERGVDLALGVVADP